MSGSALFGRFLELGLPTHDIAASVQFYERLGFRQLLTGDAWPHRYGVLGDGRIHLALHEQPAQPGPRGAGQGAAVPDCLAPIFVLPGLAGALAALRAAGVEPQTLHFGDESLHHLQLLDPGGNVVRLQEARTFSPAPSESGVHGSLCGYFLHLSLPQSDFAPARAFWERAGWVALPEEETPYPHLPLTADQLDLAFHARGGFDAPFLAFECHDVPGALARLGELGILPRAQAARGLSVRGSALLAAPEGTLLWLLPAVQDTERESAQTSA